MVKQCTKEHEPTTGVPVKKLVHLQSKILIHQSKIIRAAVDSINTGTNEMNTDNSKLEIINVMEDSYPLWQYCRENCITDMDYEDWYQNGGELSFFEGDPDIIKVHGNTGYFCRCGNTVFYYFDDMMTHDAEYLLKQFYNAFETGVTLGGYSWIKGVLPKGVSNAACIQNWDAFDKINTGIAWRGGAGYIYNIFACGQLLARA